jgi:hypothetical protein
MAGTIRCIGRSLLDVEGVITSHDNRGAPTFLMPEMSRTKFGVDLAVALKEPGTVKDQ